MARAADIDAVLPQTQCGQCGYTGCMPYAEAIACGNASINQCPPGGDEVIAELAQLLNLPAMPLNIAHGAVTAPAVAIIDENTCIGCTLCLPACPVDAIIGARLLMHTVIAAQCTGCGLCLPPCPVDCITLAENGTSRDRATQRLLSGPLRDRYQAHQQRQAARAAKHQKSRQKDKNADAAARRSAALDRAMTRARNRLGKAPD